MILFARLRFALAPLALALFMLARGAAAAPPEPRVDDLETAEQAYANLDYAAARSAADRVFKAGGLSHDQLVRVTRLLALTAAALDQPSAARDSFVALLAYDPSFQLDPKLGPRFHEPYYEAKGYWKAQPAKPGVEATAYLRPGALGSISAVVRDPTRLSQRAVVAHRWAPNRTFSVQNVSVGETQVDVPPAPPGSTRLDYFVQALDARGNVVFQVGSAAAPKSSLVVDVSPRPAGPVDSGSAQAEGGGGLLSKPLFWVAAVAVVAGGAVGSYFLFSDRDSGSSGGRWSPGLSCGGAACR